MFVFTVLLSLTGCITTHQVTTETWGADPYGLYQGYLEFTPMQPTTSHVQHCKLREDNSLDCQKQEALEAILNP